MKRNDYISWEEYFMRLAVLTAKRSKDPSTQVGACIVDPDTKKILSLGYNGFPRGCSDDEFPWEKGNKNYEDNKYPYVVHAELNAILNATSSLKGSHLYVTHEPCEECMKAIVQSGIKKISYLYPYKNNSKVRNKIIGATKIEVEEMELEDRSEPKEKIEIIKINGLSFVLSNRETVLLIITNRKVKDVCDDVINVLRNTFIPTIYPKYRFDTMQEKYASITCSVYMIRIIHNDILDDECTRAVRFKNVYKYNKHSSFNELCDIIESHIKAVYLSRSELVGSGQDKRFIDSSSSSRSFNINGEEVRIDKCFSAEYWELFNPILGDEEYGFDMTNKIVKVGNGILNWKDLEEIPMTESKVETLYE